MQDCNNRLAQIGRLNYCIGAPQKNICGTELNSGLLLENTVTLKHLAQLLRRNTSPPERTHKARRSREPGRADRRNCHENTQTAALVRTGWVGNAEYWGETMNIFRELLEEERASFCAPSVTPLIRSQSRLVTVSLNALETMMCASANWYRGQQDALHSRWAA